MRRVHQAIETVRGRQAGFTLLELTIASALLVPIVVGIGMTTSSINGSMESNNRAADVNSHARRVLAKVARLSRSAQISTIRVPAVQADVVALRATAVGQWIAPTDGVWRPGIEFKSATGLLSMNAALSTSERRAVFLMDTGETANGTDDDGDGLIDEGSIMLLQNDVTLAILKDVERLSFQLDGRMLRIRLTVARRATNKTIYRFTTESEFYIRNN